MSVTPNLCCDETKSRGTYTRVTHSCWLCLWLQILTDCEAQGTKSLLRMLQACLPGKEGSTLLSRLTTAGCECREFVRAQKCRDRSCSSAHPSLSYRLSFLSQLSLNPFPFLSLHLPPPDAPCDSALSTGPTSVPSPLLQRWGPRELSLKASFLCVLLVEGVFSQPASLSQGGGDCLVRHSIPSAWHSA